MGDPSALTSMSSKVNLSSSGKLRFGAPLWLNTSSILGMAHQADEDAPHVRAPQLLSPPRSAPCHVPRASEWQLTWNLLLYRCVASLLSHYWSRNKRDKYSHDRHKNHETSRFNEKIHRLFFSIFQIFSRGRKSSASWLCVKDPLQKAFFWAGSNLSFSIYLFFSNSFAQLLFVFSSWISLISLRHNVSATDSYISDPNAHHL